MNYSKAVIRVRNALGRLQDFGAWCRRPVPGHHFADVGSPKVLYRYLQGTGGYWERHPVMLQVVVPAMGLKISFSRRYDAMKLVGVGLKTSGSS